MVCGGGVYARCHPDDPDLTRALGASGQGQGCVSSLGARHLGLGDLRLQTSSVTARHLGCLTRALQRTAAPLGSRTVQVICPRLLQPTGRFRRRSLSLVVDRPISACCFSRIVRSPKSPARRRIDPAATRFSDLGLRVSRRQAGRCRLPLNSQPSTLNQFRVSPRTPRP